MNEQFKFSLVLFAKDTRSVYRTYKSARAQLNVGNVQIIIVKVGQNEEFDNEEDIIGESHENELIFDEFDIRDERWQEIVNDNCVTIIDASDDRDVCDEIKSKVIGTYVAFAKAGIKFHKMLMNDVNNSFEIKNNDVVMTRVRGKHNTYIREHNNYCMRFEEDTTLNTNVYLLHQIYSAYYFKVENLKWVDSINSSTWHLDIMRLVYLNVMNCDSFGCATEYYTHILSGRRAIEDWLDMFKLPETLDIFYEKFFVKMLGYLKSETIKYSLNSDYVLLFYCVKIANAVFNFEEMDEDFQKKYEACVDGFLRQLNNPEIIISNQHINKVNKGYLLVNYFPDIKAGYSQLLDVIVKPEYDKTDVKIFEPTKDGIHFEVAILEPVNRDYKVYLRTKDKEVECEHKYVINTVGWFKNTTANEKVYVVDIAYEDIDEYIGLGVSNNDKVNKMYNVNFGKYTPFSKKVFLFININNKLMYLSDEELFVQVDEDERRIGSQFEIIVSDYDKKLEKTLIKKRNKSLRAQGKAGYKSIIARMMYEKRKEKLEKQIWLISDRTTRGDDNGEVMFRYMCANPDPTVEPYFVINKDTPDYKEMKKLGKVVEPLSWEHKMLFLLNEFSLSSQANKPVINPFGKLEYLYRDLMYNKKLVFLQHGVTKDNQSKWLNKYNRNLFGFIVSTKPEYDSVFEYDYYYSEKYVWLTGMPRYDRLTHDEKKYITIMPTWRKSLSAGTNEKGVWELGEEFSSSEYFNFYNELLNNERLLTAAAKFGYKVCFMPHPNTIDGLHFFTHDERVMFMDNTFSYKDVFAQTDLMVTDYSSVAFDFAYLRKPIVYAQFDKEDFFNGEHSYTEGYFDYERDGFGEVEYTLDDVVDKIIEYMKNGCKMKDEYKERIDNTFSFSDQNCSKRVYDMIIKNRYN